MAAHKYTAAEWRDAFMAKVNILPSGCWDWTGARMWKGYGLVSRNRRIERAHRAAYTVFRGPIPDGMHLDHLCRLRSCVNPAHLEAVTPAANIQRGHASRRTAPVQGD